MPFLPPSGPYPIGSITQTLVDTSRSSHLKTNANGRRLWLKCWYPADSGEDGRPELIWAQLRTDRTVPLAVRTLLKCLRHSTSTYSRARFSPRVRNSRLIVYNHGLISFASENTSLLEELASHGFTAVAVQHMEQLPELRALSTGQSPEAKRAEARRTGALKAAKGAERARLSVEYYMASPNTNRIVIERAADTSFVLDHVSAVVEQIPGRDSGSIDPSSAHLVGFSVGGAVATEAARRDRRVASVTSLDGGMHGTLDRAEIRRPYLMMYSAANDGGNDDLLPSGARRFVHEDTAHLNYHDVSGLVPGLRLLGAIGRTDPRSFLRQRNQVVREFCTAHGA